MRTPVIRALLCTLAASAAFAQHAPSVLSVTPNNASGNRQTLSFLASDDAGGATISGVQILISADGSLANSCDFWIDRGSSGIWLWDYVTSTWGQPIIAGGPTLSNPQCTLYGGTSSIVASGNNLTVNLDLGFKAPFNGVKSFWMQAGDTSGLWSAWTQIAGSYTVHLRRPAQHLGQPIHRHGRPQAVQLHLVRRRRLPRHREPAGADQHCARRRQRLLVLLRPVQ